MVVSFSFYYGLFTGLGILVFFLEFNDLEKEGILI